MNIEFINELIADILEIIDSYKYYSKSKMELGEKQKYMLKYNTVENILIRYIDFYKNDVNYNRIHNKIINTRNEFHLIYNQNSKDYFPCK